MEGGALDKLQEVQEVKDGGWEWVVTKVGGGLVVVGGGRLSWLVMGERCGAHPCSVNVVLAYLLTYLPTYLLTY